MPLARQQGGSEALLMHLLTQGSTLFTFCCAFLEPGPLAEQARMLGFTTDVFPTTHLRDTRNYASTCLLIRKWILREQLAAVLSWMPKAHMYVAPAAVLTGTTALWFQHGISHKGMMDRITTLLPASRVLCCSAAAKYAQDKLFPGRKSSVCYPGIRFSSQEPISRSQARRRLGLHPDKPIVGMVARLEHWKGVHIFIEAARLAAPTLDGYFFVVGGAHPLDPGYAARIESMARDSGLGDRLMLTGQRPAEEVPLWQASADLIVHPVTGAEPFGMAVVEAMALGRVVIASRAGGLPEIIEDGVNGFLVEPGNSKALADTMIGTLKAPGAMDRVSAAALLRGRSFSVRRFASRVDEILVETMSSRG